MPTHQTNAYSVQFYLYILMYRSKLSSITHTYKTHKKMYLKYEIILDLPHHR